VLLREDINTCHYIMSAAPLSVQARRLTKFELMFLQTFFAFLL
jgi:hypothetical protein